MNISQALIFIGSIFLNKILINILSGEIISEDNSSYKFNIKWSPAILENGINYTIFIDTEEKPITIDTFKFCITISIDSISKPIFDDCINTKCENIEEMLNSIWENVSFKCPIKRNAASHLIKTLYIDDWVPLISGNFIFTFSMEMKYSNVTIAGKGTINIL